MFQHGARWYDPSAQVFISEDPDSGTIHYLGGVTEDHKSVDRWDSVIVAESGKKSAAGHYSAKRHAFNELDPLSDQIAYNIHLYAYAGITPVGPWEVSSDYNTGESGGTTGGGVGTNAVGGGISQDEYGNLYDANGNRLPSYGTYSPNVPSVAAPSESQDDGYQSPVGAFFSTLWENNKLWDNNEVAENQQNLEDSDYSPVAAAVIGFLGSVGERGGAGGIEDGLSGRSQDNEQLTTGQRWWRGLTGAGQIAGGAFSGGGKATAKALSEAAEKLADALKAARQAGKKADGIIEANAFGKPQGAGVPVTPEAPPTPRRVSNPKHHPNSLSPEPSNAQELFENSIVDSKGRRWSKDANGRIHRFSAPSNGESHWNGSTGGSNPIRLEDIPIDIRRLLE